MHKQKHIAKLKLPVIPIDRAARSSSGWDESKCSVQAWYCLGTFTRVAPDSALASRPL